MKTRLKILLSIFLLSTLYAIYYFVVPFAFDIQSRTPQIIDIAKNELGLNLEIEKPTLKMGLLPAVWLDADKFSIIDDDKSIPLSIIRPKVKLQLLPLFLGKIQFTYFGCDNINLNLTFDKNSRFYLGKHLLFGHSDSRFSFDKAKTDINNYKINLNDELQSKNIVIEGNYFELKKYDSKKHIQFSTDSKLKVNGRYSIIRADVDINLPLKENLKGNKLFIEGTLTNLNLEDISPYISKFSKNKIKKISGFINLESKTQRINKKTNRITSVLVLNNLSINNSNKLSSIYIKDKMSVLSVFDVKENALIVNKFKILSKNNDINIYGKILNIKSKSPLLDVYIDIIKARSEDLIALIPANGQKCKIINFAALKKYGYYSNLRGHFSVKGRTTKPKIYGKILSTDAYVLKPPVSGVEKGTVKLDFTGTKIKMNIVVPTGIGEKVFVTGISEYAGEKINSIDVKSTQNIDIKLTQSILNPVHEILYFDLGPLPVLNISGGGNINLEVRGTKPHPSLFGTVNFKNTDVGMSGISSQIKKCNSTLKFEGNNTHFYTNTAYLNEKPIKIDGKCTLQGVFDYRIEAENQDLSKFINMINCSPVISNATRFIFPAKLQSNNLISGQAGVSLNLKGNAESFDEFKLGKTVDLSGQINLSNANIAIEKLKSPLNGISGVLIFDKNITKINLSSLFNHSKININGTIKNNLADLSIKSEKLKIEDICANLSGYKLIRKSDILKFPTADITLIGKYIGAINKFDFSKIYLKGDVNESATRNGDLVLTAGSFELKNSQLNLSNLKGKFKNSQFNAKLKAKNLFDKNQSVSGSFNSSDFDISSLKILEKYDFVDYRLKKHLKSLDKIDGKVDLKINVENNNLSSRIKLSNISCEYSPNEIPLKIYGGVIELKNNKLNLYKINTSVDSMPILIDGVIFNINKAPWFNIYVNSKPNQKFIEKYVNTKALYPLKIKGDINFSSRIIGSIKSFNSKTNINLEKDSSINYMGSTIGDVNNPIKIFIDATIQRNMIKLADFQYLKFISSQNNKEFISPQLSANGLINVENKSIKLNNFKVKTHNPTDARVFNVLFKKSLIKQGLFTSDIVINGPLAKPDIKGDLNFTGVNIPLLDTIIKDIALRFKEKIIEINSTGEIFANKITLSSVLENKLESPFVFKNIDLYMENLDINKIVNSIDNIEMEKNGLKLSNSKQELNLSSVLIENAHLKADKVAVKNLSASNLIADASLNEKMVFSMDKFQFDIAEGNVKGKFKYNLLSSTSSLDMAIDNVNANEIAFALFDLRNQLYGSLTGDVNLSCNGKSHSTCMETLSGRGGFQVKDGKMPKLGSLEYLLKATNLVKSGVTGLSINGIIDFITPLKTGQFEAINGNFNIGSGIADSIQIFSKGKDLSLFINGTYNFSTLIADMNIFGRLSKKISTVLGPVGNASLNTLFNIIPGLNLDEANNAIFIKEINKIPGFELNDKMYRIFNAKIYGDINGDNYVQSFRWVE